MQRDIRAAPMRRFLGAVLKLCRGRFGPFLGLSLGIVGASAGAHWGSLNVIGGVWSRLCVSWGHPGVSRSFGDALGMWLSSGPLEASRGPRRDSLVERLGALLGGDVALFATSGTFLWPSSALLGPPASTLVSLLGRVGRFEDRQG